MGNSSGRLSDVNLLIEAQNFYDLIQEFNFIPQLFQKTIAKEALRRYESLWLPLVAEYLEIRLIAPLDIELIWIVHMHNPDAYLEDCMRLYGTLLNHTIGTFEERRENTTAEYLWKKKYPNEPFAFTTTPRKVPFISKLSSNIIKALDEFRIFCRQVALPHFKDEKFLSTAINEYLHNAQFDDYFKIAYPYNRAFIWKSHMVNPQAYQNDIAYLEEIIDYSKMDQLNSRCSSNQGAMFRGSVAPLKQDETSIGDILKVDKIYMFSITGIQINNLEKSALYELSIKSKNENGNEENLTSIRFRSKGDVLTRTYKNVKRINTIQFNTQNSHVLKIQIMKLDNTNELQQISTLNSQGRYFSEEFFFPNNKNLKQGDKCVISYDLKPPSTDKSIKNSAKRLDNSNEIIDATSCSNETSNNTSNFFTNQNKLGNNIMDVNPCSNEPSNDTTNSATTANETGNTVKHKNIFTHPRQNSNINDSLNKPNEFENDLKNSHNTYSLKKVKSSYKENNNTYPMIKSKANPNFTSNTYTKAISNAYPKKTSDVLNNFTLFQNMINDKLMEGSKENNLLSYPTNLSSAHMQLKSDTSEINNGIKSKINNDIKSEINNEIKSEINNEIKSEINNDIKSEINKVIKSKNSSFCLDKTYNSECNNNPVERNNNLEEPNTVAVTEDLGESSNAIANKNLKEFTTVSVNVNECNNVELNNNLEESGNVVNKFCSIIKEDNDAIKTQKDFNNSLINKNIYAGDSNIQSNNELNKTCNFPTNNIENNEISSLENSDLNQRQVFSGTLSLICFEVISLTSTFCLNKEGEICFHKHYGEVLKQPRVLAPNATKLDEAPCKYIDLALVKATTSKKVLKCRWLFSEELSKKDGVSEEQFSSVELFDLNEAIFASSATIGKESLPNLNQVSHPRHCCVLMDIPEITYIVRGTNCDSGLLQVTKNESEKVVLVQFMNLRKLTKVWELLYDYRDKSHIIYCKSLKVTVNINEISVLITHPQVDISSSISLATLLLYIFCKSTFLNDIS